MDINTNVVRNYQTAEYGKFVELGGTGFPAVSVVRLSYPDNSSAFPSNSAAVPLSSVDVYPKYAVLSYIANPEDISLSLSLSSLSLSGITIDTSALENIASTINSNTSATNFVLRSISSNTSATNDRLFNIDTDLDTTNSRLQTIINQTDQLESRTLNIQNNTGALNIAATDIITLLNDLTGKQTTVNEVENLLRNTNTILVTSFNPSDNFDNIGGYVVSIHSNVQGARNQLDNTLPSIQANVQDIRGFTQTSRNYLEEIVINTESGTTSNNPLFVNTGALIHTVDSISVDSGITQTTTRSLSSRMFISGERRVYNLFGISTANVNQYIQLYNTTTTTPSGTPVSVFFIPSNSNFNFDFVRGLNFTNGVLIVNSITPIDYNQGNDDLFMTAIHN